MLRPMTLAERVAPIVRSPWFPRAVLAGWAVLMLLLSLEAGTTSGTAHTVGVVALLAGAACVIGWYLLVRRERQRTQER
jgi:hypothetical protein